jgi:drug/metabolite transporter (DMT)-like permease
MYTGIVYMTAALTTLMLCLLQGSDVIQPMFSSYELTIFLALAVFPTVLGHSVNNYLLTLVPAYVVSSAVLGEPIGATLLATVFLNQVPTPSTVCSFLVIIGGIGLVLAGTKYVGVAGALSLDDTDRPQSNDLGGDTDGI